MAQKKKNINLLIQRGAPATLWERAYEWVTNTARIIVIITEAVVLSLFAWRFVLDRRLNDLKENIDIKGTVLGSLSEQESEIRTLQARLANYRQVREQSSNYFPIFQEVSDYIPTEVKDLSISISESEDGVFLVISGQTSRDSIDTLENKVKDSESFSDVTLTTLEGGTAELDTFTLTAKVIFEQKRVI